MKKKYITPTLDVVQMKTQNLILGSITIDDNADSGTGTLFDDPLDTEDPVLSRESFWDDEEFF